VNPHQASRQGRPRNLRPSDRANRELGVPNTGFRSYPISEDVVNLRRSSWLASFRLRVLT
jgi:hypothetical protein